MTTTVTVQKLDAHAIDSFVDLLRVFEVVFEMTAYNMPPQPHLQRLLEQDSFWVFVAVINGEVVGGLTAHVLPQYYTERPLVYLYDMAVSIPHQRQGVGRQLLAGLTQYSRSLGVDEVFVQADGDDAEAINFYQTTGGRAESVVHFTYPCTH